MGIKIDRIKECRTGMSTSLTGSSLYPTRDSDAEKHVS